MQIFQALTRLCVQELDGSLAFYEALFGQPCSLRFSYPEARLELAQVGPVLLLCGDDEALAPFRETKVTFLVDSVEAYRTFLLQNGAEIVRDIRRVPTGKNLTVRHADGTVAEYVEHAK